MQLIRSLLYTTWLFLGTLLYAVVVLLLSWLPPLKLYAVANNWARTQLWMLKVLCGLTYVVEGAENIPSGAHISMWKHSSAWETIAQAAIFPPQAWVLKRELMWIPLVGWRYAACNRSRSIARPVPLPSIRLSSRAKNGWRRACGCWYSPRAPESLKARNVSMA